MLIAALSLVVWLYLFFGHGRFWRSTPELDAVRPAVVPDVDIVVPARDEAESIGAVIRSLLAQDYAGHFRVILVDDGSSDGTADLARAAATAAAGSGPGAAPPTRAELTVLSGQPKPPGWSGKLWALQQGIAAGNAPVLLFADADIVHDARHLSALVARLEHSAAGEPALDMVSEMVRLNCTSAAERALVPAFVYFFQMLYPFARVNDPRAATAAAAGGTVLIRRSVLDRVGGLQAIRGALIDDVTLASKIKKLGPIYLAHSNLANSIRPYPHVRDIGQMVARTAFTQLRHSAWLLVATLASLTLVWWVPIGAVLLGQGRTALMGLAAWGLSASSYLPTLRRYGRSPLWALALPGIALFYMGATVNSAVTHWRGRGARWKSRDYGTDV